jgi:hypothetical protein
MRKTMKYNVITVLFFIASLSAFAQRKWVPVGPGADAEVLAMCADTVSKTLYVGGHFTHIGAKNTAHIAKYKNQSWDSIGVGTDGPVKAILAKGSKLYVGGSFSTAGGVPAKNIAVFDTLTKTWTELGGGVNTDVNTLCFYHNDLYAGGSFDTITGKRIKYIAKWNGTAWSAVSSTDSLDGFVHSLSVFKDTLYAMGSFLASGSTLTTLNYAAKWDGIKWVSLTTGLDFGTYCSTVCEGGLYVGGEFGLAGDSLANGIAKWNGTAWNKIGTGVLGGVFSIMDYHSTLLVAGSFDIVGGAYDSAKYVGGGLAARKIASWNGTKWDSLSNGLNAKINTLSKHNNMVFAGGEFTSSGDSATALPYIAKWCDVKAVVSSNVTICAGQTATLSASGGSSYGWSSGASSSVITVSPTITTHYRVAVTGKEGCTDTAFVKVVVNPTPTVSITGNTTICNGQNITLTALGGVTYFWSTTSTSSSIVVAPTTTTLYSVTTTNSANCSATNTTTVQVGGMYSLSVSPTNASCATCTDGAASVTPSVGGGYSYSWNTSPVQTTTTATGLAVGDYSVCVTDSYNCSVCKSLNISFSTSSNETTLVSSFILYPNPAKEFVLITKENGSAGYASRVYIYDICGKEIVSAPFELNKIRIALNDLAKGLYLVKVQHNGKSLGVKKLIIE